MYSLMSVAAGMVLEAVIVHRTRNRMRVIVPGFSDALELRRSGQAWFTEVGEPVEFEFLADLPSTEHKVAEQIPFRRAAGV